MSRLLLTAVAVGLLGLAGASVRAADLSGLRAEAAATPAEKLTLCDTTAFLATRPDTDADAIYVRLQSVAPLRLAPPHFVAAGRLYGEGPDQLFQRLRSRGEITRAELSRAQANVGARLVEAYSPDRPLPAAFVRDQLRYCHRWGAGYGVNLDF